MKKNIMVLFVLVFVLMLVGCQSNPDQNLPSTSNPAVSSEVLPVGSAEPEKIYTYYECIEPLKGFQPQHVRWDTDGGFSVRQKDSILFIDQNNDPIRTFYPVDRNWIYSPWELSSEDWENPTFCEYTWNETYVLARFNLYSSLGAVVAEKSGLPIIADAAIYNMNGQIIKAFPSTYDQDVKNRLNNENYAWMISVRTSYCWIDADILAINSGDGVWLYSVSRDEIKRVADYSEDLLAAWHREESYAFGISEYQCWAENGRLYYAVGHGVQGTGEEQYVHYSLWSVDWDTPATCLSGDRLNHQYQIKNDVLFAANYHREQVGADLMTIHNLEYLNEKTGEYITIGTGGEQVDVATNQDLVAYTTYRREVPGEQLQYTIHYQDFQSEGKLSWEVIRPETKGDSFVILLDVSRLSDGVRFSYYVEDIHEMGRTVTLVTYNTTTGKAIFTPIDSTVVIPSGKEVSTHFLETDMQGSVRLRPIP